MHMHIGNNSLEIVEILLNAGADINKQNMMAWFLNRNNNRKILHYF